MSTRHVRSVQQCHGNYDDPTDFLIMQVIATDIGFNGEPCNTSYRTISGRTGLHYNTVSARIKKLTDQGHLMADKRGKYNYYSLPFNCDNEPEDYHNDSTLSQPSSVTSDNHDCDNSERLSQIEQRLSQLEALIITISQNIVTTDQRENVTKVSEVSEEEREVSARAREHPHPHVPWPENDAQKWQATHEATWTWCEAGFDFPGYDNIGTVIEKLGEAPDLDALIKARRLWTMSSYRPGNYLGILDWYENIRGDPAWEPSKRFSKNGKHPEKEQAPDQNLKPIKPGSARY